MPAISMRERPRLDALETDDELSTCRGNDHEQRRSYIDRDIREMVATCVDISNA